MVQKLIRRRSLRRVQNGTVRNEVVKCAAKFSARVYRVTFFKVLKCVARSIGPISGLVGRASDACTNAGIASLISCKNMMLMDYYIVVAFKRD